MTARCCAHCERIAQVNEHQKAIRKIRTDAEREIYALEKMHKAAQAALREKIETWGCQCGEPSYE